jgi:hypothetical protein
MCGIVFLYKVKKLSIKEFTMQEQKSNSLTDENKQDSVKINIIENGDIIDNGDNIDNSNDQSGKLLSKILRDDLEDLKNRYIESTKNLTKKRKKDAGKKYWDLIDLYLNDAVPHNNDNKDNNGSNLYNMMSNGLIYKHRKIDSTIDICQKSIEGLEFNKEFISLLEHNIYNRFHDDIKKIRVKNEDLDMLDKCIKLDLKNKNHLEYIHELNRLSNNIMCGGMSASMMSDEMEFFSIPSSKTQKNNINMKELNKLMHFNPDQIAKIDLDNLEEKEKEINDRKIKKGKNVCLYFTVVPVKKLWKYREDILKIVITLLVIRYLNPAIDYIINL